jgi:transposase InsO family protein
MDIRDEIDWANIQDQDSVLKNWKKYVKEGRKPKRGEVSPSPFFKLFDQLSIEDGILYRNVKIQDQELKQLVVPSVHIANILEALHNEMGHQGRDRTTNLIRERFYWPGMTTDIEKWLNQCENCIKRKKEPSIAPLVNIETTQPLELVCIDYLTLEKCKGGFENILVITDHFTRYAQAIPTRNQTAKTTAEILFNNFINHYGIPQRIHSDQGANFESNLMKELCNLMGTNKSRTTPYHPMGNGMTERFNRTLLNMLGTMDTNKKQNWKSYVATMVHAYNCTKHESTGQSPYFLMFGRNPNLPIDIAFGLAKKRNKNPQTKYIQNLRSRLVEAYKTAAEQIKKSQEKQKSRYDLKTRGAVIQKGDRVMVKMVRFDGKHKLANKWEDDIYIVTDQPNENIPVYTVVKENGLGRVRTLHRNLLFPIGCIQNERLENSAPEKPKPKPRPRKSKIAETRIQDSSSSEEDEVLLRRHELTSTSQDQSDLPSVISLSDAGSASRSVEVIEEDMLDTGAESEETDDRDGATAEISEDEEEEILRRSTRRRGPPKWMTSGEFVAKSATTKNWKERADYAVKLMEKGVIQKAEKTSDAILNFILKS